MLRQTQLVRPFVSEGRYAFTAPIPQNFLQFTGSDAISVVSEDGLALGPADTMHQEIRDVGCGSFSVWGATVYFSASDNTDCNENGRAYTLSAIDIHSDNLLNKLAADDELLLQLINRSCRRNNSFFPNFFENYTAITDALRRNRIALPKSALEIGSGPKPFTALRCLLEGAERVVVNDTVQVTGRHSADFLHDLHILLGLVQHETGARLDAIANEIGSDGKRGLRGLEIYDEQPFETLQIRGDFDLIFSTSVLEHVMKPREVVQKMRGLLKSGCHSWHSIDLRDHRDLSVPLAFLEMTPEEYAAVNTENRLRASEWCNLFEELGFQLIDRQFTTLPLGVKFPVSSNLIHRRERPDKAWVDEAMRAKFKPPFDRMDLIDLSLVGISVLHRRP